MTTVRELRQQKGWTQEQLAQFSGLNIRTIQRIEQGHNPGLESLKALAAVFNIPVSALQTKPVNTEASASWLNTDQPFIQAIRNALRQYAVFEGYAARAEYWWFVLFVALVAAAGSQIHQILGGLVLILFAVPLLSAGARRLHDTGRSGWWQLCYLVPVGGAVLVMILKVQPANRKPAD